MDTFEIETGNNALIVAIENGHADIVKILVQKGAKINLVDVEGNTALHYAAINRNKDIVKILLEASEYLDEQSKEEFLNQANTNGQTALQLAAQKNNKEIFYILIEEGAKAAVENGNEDIIEMLLEKSKNFKSSDNSSDNYFDKAFLNAAKKGSTKIIEMFIKYYENFELNNNITIFSQALMEAVKEGHTDIVNTLVEKGAKIDLQDKYGNTALHYAAINGNEKIVSCIFEEINKGKISKEEFLNQANTNGQTSLQLAAQKGHAEIVDTLLKAGAKIDLVDAQENTVLHYASFNGNENIVSCLVNEINKDDRINKEDFLDHTNTNGQTALQLAAQMGHAEIFDTLLKAGAKIDLVDKEENTVLHYASFNGNENIVNCIFEEIKKDDRINKEEFLNQANEKGQTALGFAVKKGNAKIVDKLVKEGANIDSVDNHRNTVLHYASLNSNTDVVNFILEKINRNQSGIDINQTNKEGQTALDFAVTLRKKEVISILIVEYKKLDNEGKKFFLNHVDGSGTTALHRAVIKGFKDIVKILLEASEDLDEQSKEEFLNQTNKNGQTALDLANQRPRPDTGIVNILIDAGAKQQSKQAHVLNRY